MVEDVEVTVGLKCRLASEVLCDKHIPTWLKDNFLQNNDQTSYDPWSKILAKTHVKNEYSGCENVEMDAW